MATDGIGGVAQIVQGALEVEAHHRLVAYRVRGVQADEEVVDAEFGEGIDSLRRTSIAVGIEAQLGLGQAAVNHIEPRQDLWDRRRGRLAGRARWPAGETRGTAR